MSSTRACFLGLDCGTGSTKALLLDAADGSVIAARSSPHPIDARLDGTSEQDPGDWLRAATSAVRAVLEAAGSVSVRGIGVSGQQHGLVALGDDGMPVRPAKLWNDTTTAEECAILTDAVGGLEAGLALTGNRFLSGYTAPKILWLRRHEQDRYAAARRFCLPHDYLNLWLTGEFVTEPGDASGTAYFDVRRREYSRPVLEAIDADRDWDAALPPVVASQSVIGQLRADVAQALGLEPDIPVAAGGGDNMCAAIGIGAVSEGPVVVSLGTSATAFGHRDEPALDPLGEVSAFCDSTGGWLPLACTLNCTGVVDWARALAGAEALTVDQALDASPAGARGLTFLPYLSGERTPDLPRAAGTLLGLRLDHGPADVIRAAVEGVTDGLAFALEALGRTGTRPDRLVLVGGGANSDRWGQLVADMTRLPVERPSGTEAAAEGAARQARWVIAGAAPDGFEVGARWEPREDPGLDDVRGRLGRGRDLAGRGLLA
ncbi:MAG TPA: xylulokinase [Candidatus Limnocylindria bacterium]|nr:xylulokinase [Candidatus Limnocylindria bacterium]